VEYEFVDAGELSGETCGLSGAALLEASTAKRFRLWELNAGQCRWPLGKAFEPAMFFCGEPVKRGCSWCAEHHAKAFTRAGLAFRASRARRQKTS
jgi:hypothetical protein